MSKKTTETEPKSVSLFGSTGSVGVSTIDIIERNPERFSTFALTANSNVELLAKQALVLKPRYAVVRDETCYRSLKKSLSGSGVEVLAGEKALVDVAGMKCGLSVAAIVGAPGLQPTLAAIGAGNDIALANKETLVCAGALVMELARQKNVRILPVDSEHSGVFQCLDGGSIEKVSKVTLTASGGPFRTMSFDDIKNVTVDQALKHPRWSMGPKISIDSATLMNKGLELIEAMHLFALKPDQLDVVVHPQSTIHALVSYIDGSVLAQMASPDMRLPIAYALGWPERISTPCPPLDLIALARMDFEAPDVLRFPALKLAQEAMATGGNAPAVLNAANEEAVAAFLSGQISFTRIAEIVEDALSNIGWNSATELPQILTSDEAARGFVRRSLS